jgi:3-oxoacyl-[acyl-carrier protein] reductase
VYTINALTLGKAGAQVVVHYGRSAAEAEAVVAEIRDGGRRGRRRPPI